MVAREALLDSSIALRQTEETDLDFALALGQQAENASFVGMGTREQHLRAIQSIAPDSRRDTIVPTCNDRWRTDL